MAFYINLRYVTEVGGLAFQVTDARINVSNFILKYNTAELRINIYLIVSTLVLLPCWCPRWVRKRFWP